MVAGQSPHCELVIPIPTGRVVCGRRIKWRVGLSARGSRRRKDVVETRGWDPSLVIGWWVTLVLRLGRDPGPPAGRPRPRQGPIRAFGTQRIGRTGIGKPPVEPGIGSTADGLTNTSLDLLESCTIMRLGPTLVGCALPALGVALSALDRPRAGFLQDVLESSTADQKYCKVSWIVWFVIHSLLYCAGSSGVSTDNL